MSHAPCSWRCAFQLVVAAALCCASGMAGAGKSLFAETLRVKGEITSLLVRDSDGDGLQELWVSYHEGGQRFIGVFRGSTRYRDLPELVVPVDERAILHAVGDFDPASGLELLLIARASAALYTVSMGEGIGDPRRLFLTRLFFRMPSRTECPPWLSDAPLDLDGNGLEDICVPEVSHLRLLLQKPSPGGRAWDDVRLPVSYYLLTDTREEKLRATVEELLETEGYVAPLLDVTGAFPFPLATDFDGDGRLDIVVKQPGNHLEVFFQRAAGAFSTEPDLRLSLPWMKDATSLLLVELNGDARPDLVASRLRLNELSSEIQVFIQDPEDKDRGLARPLQSLRVRGFFRGPDVADVNEDGRVDLLVTAYRVDLLERSAGKSVEEVEVTHEVFPGNVFPGDATRPFGRRPAYQSKFLLRSRVLEGGPPRPWIHAGKDITGDGRPDVLFVDNGQYLRLYRGVRGRGFAFEEDKSFAEKIEDPLAVRIVNLDRRRGDEIILRYSRRIEIRRAHDR